MKITAQEEYGLRILLRIARTDKPEGITISEISKSEGLSQHNVAKLCRILRMANFIKSSRGKAGGYMLTEPPEKIFLNEVLEVLGGKLFSPDFCHTHSGTEKSCRNSPACSVRFLWQFIQKSVDDVLMNLTLSHLLTTGSVGVKMETASISEQINLTV